MNLFKTTAPGVAGMQRAGVAGAAVEKRANIFEMTQAAEDAVLRPRETGAFSHDLRAALAARIARLSGDDALAQRYLIGAGEEAALADLSTREEDVAPMLGFVDKVASRARDITNEDIVGLWSGGMADADIVRLCELIAFVAYQVRVVAGLRLMKAGA